MLIGQTMFSVRKGTEHRAERALQELAGIPPGGAGTYRPPRAAVVRHVAARQRARDEGREATLGDVHFIFETAWESLELHDEFYQSPPVQRIYGTLQSILTSGPFEVLYDTLVEEPQHDNAAV